MLKKIFGIIYFAFSILMILVTFKGKTFLKMLSFLFSILMLVIFLNKKEKVLRYTSKKNIVTCLIVIFILIRIFLLFLPYAEPYSDYANFYNSSINYSKNQTIDKYVATFPHLIPFIVVLGTIFSIFNIDYKVVVFLNIIFDLLSFYLLMKGFKNKKMALFWLVDPINIMWCSVCHPTVITNFFLIASILILKKILKYINLENKRIYLLAIFFSFILSIANLFRPIMIILLIAMFIYLLLSVISKEKFKRYFSVILLVFISYFCFTNLYTTFEKKIDKNIATTTIGWNLYVGSNISSNGTWNLEQQNEFNEVFLTDMTPTDIQKYFLTKGIDQYKQNQLGNIELFIKKFVILLSNSDGFTCDVFNAMQKNKIGKIGIILLKILTGSFYYILLIFNLIMAFWTLKEEKCEMSLLLQLFIIGVVSSNLFLEVSSRYSLPLVVPLTVLIILYLEKVLVTDNKLCKRNVT